jgi:hypothetical protein
MDIVSASIAVALLMSLALNIFLAVLLARKNAPGTDESLSKTSPVAEAADKRPPWSWSY